MTYYTTEATYHSWVLGIDNLAKWQENMLHLNCFWGFLAINLQFLINKSYKNLPFFTATRKRSVYSLRCAKMHKPQKISNDQFFKLIETMLSNLPKIANLEKNLILKIYILKVEKSEFSKKSIKK
jgi:hypothetical protein